MNNIEKGYYLDHFDIIVLKLQLIVTYFMTEAHSDSIESGEKVETTTRYHDAQHVQSILSAVKERKWEKAKDLAWSMDTEPREHLPEHFWEYD
ncbi:hypothetical protein N9X64_00605 [bacterium]|nr:hypothetical protein [bacterium]